MLKTTTILLVMAGSLPLMAAPPVIYGEDNRREVYEASTLEQKLAASKCSRKISPKIN